MTTWRPTLTAITQRAALGRLGNPLSKDDGESLMVVPLLDHPGLLVKFYRAGVCGPGDGDRIDRLIAMPRRLDNGERQVLRDKSCWPVSRVVDSEATVGVVFPLAPAKFNATLSRPKGVGESRPLVVDWLAQPPERQVGRGLPGTTFDQRLSVCRDFVAVAAILEREGIVYGDWSYANALWSSKDFSGFLIDVDSCSFGSRPYVGTLNWEDPLTGKGAPVDNFTDRYRLALMVARCLSGERDTAAARHAAVAASFAKGKAELGHVVNRVLTAPSRTARPSIADVLRAMSEQAALGNVTHWIQVGKAHPAPQHRPPVAPHPIPTQHQVPVQHRIPAQHRPSTGRPVGSPPSKPETTSGLSIFTLLVLVGLVVLIIALLLG